MGVQDREYMGKEERSGKLPNGKWVGIGFSVLIAMFIARNIRTDIGGGEEYEPTVIPVPYEVKVEPTIGEIAPVDLNTATAAEITLIPGLPDPVAHAIFRGRPYREEEDLLGVPGIKERRLELIRPYITLSPVEGDPKEDGSDVPAEDGERIPPLHKSLPPLLHAE